MQRGAPSPPTALVDAMIVPRPEQPLRVWLGTGGSPGSVLRAAELGLPMFLGILGGTPEHWGAYGHAYREAWSRVGHPADGADIAVAVHGFVAENDRQAKATYLEHEIHMFEVGMAKIGRTAPAPSGRAVDVEAGGMVFVGGPNEVADRILHFHELLGHSRQILQMDVAGAVDGADAVISALGRTLRRGATGTPVAEGTRNIVEAMKAAGVRRLIGLATPSVADPATDPPSRRRSSRSWRAWRSPTPLPSSSA